MTRRAYFCIATGKYAEYAKNLEASLRKFDKDTDFVVFKEGDTQMARDPEIFYRGTPYFAKKMFERGYTEVCHLDSDQIILGDLKDIWEGDYDVAVVLNDPTYKVAVWDIAPYFNNGLNVFKSKEFVDEWLRLCYTPHFFNYQFREQDLLNILCSDYRTYKVRMLDEGDKWYGEVGKPMWSQMKLKDGKVIFTSNQGEKQLCVYHAGGGNAGQDKMNYRIRFDDSVIKYIDGLIK